MVLWILCVILILAIVASWLYCRKEENLHSFKMYLVGKISILLLLLLVVSSRTLSFFCYNEEIREINIEQIARFNDGGKDKILAIVEVDGENLAFEISKNSDLEAGDKLKISRKFSKFPTFDNWIEDWVVKK